MHTHAACGASIAEVPTWRAPDRDSLKLLKSGQAPPLVGSEAPAFSFGKVAQAEIQTVTQYCCVDTA